MGLVQYDSSDEDEEVQSPPTDPHPPNSAVKPTSSSSQKSAPDSAPAPGPSEPAAPLAQQQPEASSSSSSASASEAQASSAPDPAPALGPVLGPAFGPSRPPPKEERPRLEGELELEEDEEGGREGGLGEVDLSFLDDAAGAGAGGGSPPRSPYTRTRALLRNLTLPSVPNMDIPPSPPGSPPAHLDALTAKFDSFLRLKRARGVHFNERLAGSSGMANPAVADKLLAFVGVGTEFPTDGDGGGSGGGRGLEQYATVLSPEVWDGGASFPEWAFKGALRKTQERVNKERERGRGEAVEFVSAGVLVPGAAGGGETAGSAGGSRAGTPGAGSGVGKRRGR
ncbi:hypothetical protein MYCTH_2132225 [Thermothelomyces thermophilus ATCC 42464]|uniref:HCNGP-like protein n=1 Tax=Thermothelomyces thermophilus (strain ATCC 42464 / BCRC 31852 / DSM 1799) TaxID=573729 RepID=G2Q482_THET4|nr:uncharacterized protein MYCTH_2132225 [Thermothelomyces thermophilus ATCC 42464]AEO54477.1 hypothetical protein MYCTH_2132225 [Thermothelomyces thermophilus ATCC 42464]